MEDKIIKRATIVALILAILFGILQYIPRDRTYDSITIETILKIISSNSFNILLLPFLIYFIFVGINLGNRLVIPERILEGVYNFAILLAFLVITFTVGFALIINLMILFPIINKLLTFLLIGLWILISIGWGILLEKSLKK